MTTDEKTTTINYIIPTLLVAAAVLLLTITTFVFAHASSYKIGPNEHTSIHARHKMMENSSFSAKAGNAMARGAVPYDGQKAEAIMRLMRTTADNMLEHFNLKSIPKAGSRSQASRRIWSDWEGFTSKVQQFQTVAEEAESTAADGPTSFKAGLRNILKECKSCHEAYKMKK